MRGVLASVLVLWTSGFAAAADTPVALAPGVRGLVTRASGKVVIDGSLREWSEAFCTPVGYGHRDPENRAGQFYYLWDDEAFYLGLRCLDKKQANPGAMTATYDGDAVEFYFDVRPGDGLRGKEWSQGALHFHYAAFQGKELKPRWVIRKGIATSDTVLEGVEIAATRQPESYEIEFKIPWANFPDFQPKLGALMAVDAELCSGDGGARVDRTFSYGSPLSVQQPASLGMVELVRSFDPEYLEQVGPSAFPMRVKTPWVQPERAMVEAVVAIPPGFVDVVGLVEVRIHNVDGKIVKTLPAQLESFGPRELGFERAIARWSIDDYAPGAFFATAKLSARTGKVLTTVAPRLVDEAIVKPER